MIEILGVQSQRWELLWQSMYWAVEQLVTVKGAVHFLCNSIRCQPCSDFIRTIKHGDGWWLTGNGDSICVSLTRLVIIYSMYWSIVNYLSLLKLLKHCWYSDLTQFAARPVFRNLEVNDFCLEFFTLLTEYKSGFVWWKKSFFKHFLVI